MKKYILPKVSINRTYFDDIILTSGFDVNETNWFGSLFGEVNN